MALEFRRTPDQLRDELIRIANQAGFRRLDRFIGGLIDVLVDTYAPAYETLEDLEDQVRIDTASDEFLDSWGSLLDELRSTTVRLESLALDNTFITTNTGQPVNSLTLGGVPLQIPSGSLILDENNAPLLRVLDTTTFNNERAFVRVVGARTDIDRIAPGTYQMDGTLQDYVLGRSSGAVGESRVILNDAELVATIQREIVGQAPALDDEEFRFILLSKARALNLANRDRVNTLLRNPDIARFVIREFTDGSSSVNAYIEPTRVVLDKALELATDVQLQRTLPYGTQVRTGRMVLSRVGLDYRISIQASAPINQKNEIIAQVKTVIKDFINALDSGTEINFDDLITEAQGVANVGDVLLDNIRINGRSILTSRYRMRDIEKLFINEASISIEVI